MERSEKNNSLLSSIIVIIQLDSMFLTESQQKIERCTIFTVK